MLKKMIMRSNFGKKVKLTSKVTIAKKTIERLGGLRVYADRYMPTLSGIELTNLSTGGRQIVYTVDAGPAPYTMAQGAPLAMGIYPIEDSHSKPVIVVDNDLRSLSAETVGFVMLHETGHMYQIYVEKSIDVFGPTVKAAAVGDVKLVNDIYFEFYADEFAAAFMGREKAMAALTEMKQFFERTGILFKELAGSFDCRIDHLRSAVLPDPTSIQVRQMSDLEVIESLQGVN